MTFRELLAAYREGTLDDEKRREAEREIERADALLEYLSERDEIPGMSDKSGDEHAAGDDESFNAAISRRIRRAFIRLGVCVGAVLLTVLLSILYVMPHVVDRLYYDPGEIVSQAETVNNADGTAVFYPAVNRMSLDMAVYSELFLPGAYRDSVSVIDNGYGNYDIVIPQNLSLTGRFTEVGGRISRGRLILYDNNTLKPPVGNCFEWSLTSRSPDKSLSEQARMPEMKEDGRVFAYAGTPAGYPDEAREKIEALEDGTLYRGFVSFENVIEYETFYRFLRGHGLREVWCAVQLDERPGYAPNIGFDTWFGNGARLLRGDNERYPLLKYGDEDLDLREIKTAERAQQHMESLLRYYADQKSFREMLAWREGGETPERFDQYLEWLDEHGVWVYGFCVTADRDTLLALQDDPWVYSVYAQIA